MPKPRVSSQSQSQQQTHVQQDKGGRGGTRAGDYDGVDTDHYFDASDSKAHRGMDMGAEYAQESRIMELEAQHHNRKLQIEAMKKNLGLK